MFSHLEPSDSALKVRRNGLNEKIERISKLIYFLVVKLTTLGVLLPALFITLINYFIYDLKDDSYYLSFPIAYVGSSIHIFVGLPFEFSTSFYPRFVRVPFDWKTPFGYLIVSIGVAVSMFVILSVFVPLLCFTIGSTLTAIFLTDDIVNNLIIFNNFTKKSTEHLEETKQHLCNIIQDFSQTKQFSL